MRHQEIDTDSTQMTPLMRAAGEQGQMWALMTTLDDSKCELDATDPMGMTATHVRCRQRSCGLRAAVAGAWRRRLQKGEKRPNGCALATESTMRRQKMMTDTVDSTWISRWTPLMRAAGEGDTETLLAVLDNNRCELDATDAVGMTALMHAAVNGHVSCVQLLLEHGADACKKAQNARTAVHGAAWSGSKDALLALLDARCGVDIADDENMTPLMVAAERGVSGLHCCDIQAWCACCCTLRCSASPCRCFLFRLLRMWTF